MTLNIVDNPSEWKEIIEHISNYLNSEINNFESITLVGRCINCFHKSEKIILTFHDKHIDVNVFEHNCNTNSITNNTFSLQFHNIGQFDFRIQECDDFFQLLFVYHHFVGLEIPITTTYEKKDYQVHGRYVYKDSKLRLKQRKIDNGIIMMLQSFIDFKGLDPYYSHTISIKYKTNP